MTKQTYQPGGVNLASTHWIERLRRTRRLLMAWLKCGCGTSHFDVQGRRYRYFLHAYNQTWSNERCVEVAVARGWLDGKADSLLEIGNVMSHYGLSGHDVLDKYEQRGSCSNLIQEDILDFKQLNQYKHVLSISTLEHVGRDEEVGDSTLAIESLRSVRESLQPAGKALVTFAIGYNQPLDEYVRKLALSIGSGWQVSALKRSGPVSWHQVEPRETVGVAYGSPFPCGNGVFILTAKEG